MIYKNIFDLIGSAQQVDIIKQAIDKIHFPWDRIRPPGGVFKIGWANLNSGTGLYKVNNERHHKGHNDGPQAINGTLHGREYVMGVFYPHNGDIYLDSKLVLYPHLAQATVSAEMAHLVDEYLPLTEAQRHDLHKLMHLDGLIPRSEGAGYWFERVDYSTEYFSLPGEFFMAQFTLAYSDMPFDAGSFSHSMPKSSIPRVRQIIGIERTDLVPAPPKVTYKRLGTGKTYHRLTHYPAKPGKQITDTTGLYPCKTCKP